MLQFNEKVLETLKSELNTCLDAANTSELREIKGLEDRLYGLEQLMCDTRKIVQEQGDLAQVCWCFNLPNLIEESINFVFHAVQRNRNH